jgi:SecD/SecF fusion protein
VLDREILSVPQIDWQENPDGLDGSDGTQIAGGFDEQEADTLTTTLLTGALPVDLELLGLCPGPGAPAGTC